MVYDIGDISVTPFNNINDINQIYEKILNCKEIPKLVFIGGDHTISYPILKFMKENVKNKYHLYILIVTKIHGKNILEKK